MLMLLSWVLPCLESIVVDTYLTQTYPTISTYNPRTCECKMTYDSASETYLFLCLIIPAIFFLIGPSCFNIGSYFVMLLRIVRTRSRTVSGGRRSGAAQTSAITIRALVITSVNIISYVPYLVCATVLRAQSSDVARLITVSFLYINCIMDPILYASTKSSILNFMAKKVKARRDQQLHSHFTSKSSDPLSHGRGRESVQISALNMLEVVPKLVVYPATVMSSSGMFFQNDPILLAVHWEAQKNSRFSAV